MIYKSQVIDDFQHSTRNLRLNRTAQYPQGSTQQKRHDQQVIDFILSADLSVLRAAVDVYYLRVRVQNQHPQNRTQHKSYATGYYFLKTNTVEEKFQKYI